MLFNSQICFDIAQDDSAIVCKLCAYGKLLTHQGIYLLVVIDHLTLSLVSQKRNEKKSKNIIIVQCTARDMHSRG